MELTSVVLDLQENFDRGRCYLPLQWLREAGLDRYNYWEHEHRDALMNVVARLIHVSERYYLLGAKNLREISLRASFAVAIELLFHRELGRIVLRGGAEGLGKDVEISRWMKAFLILHALVLVLKIKLVR